MKLPKIICSSVIRSTHQGQSHGGVYITDLEKDNYEQVIDWNDPDIDWSGRGSDRGLRGIALYNNEVYLAASDEIFVYNNDFNLIKSFRNRYMKDCHAISISGDSLLISSTGYDSILEFDLISESFVGGYCLRDRSMLLRRVLARSKLSKKIARMGIHNPKLNIFDPNSGQGPFRGDMFHVNNVFHLNGLIFFSGTGFDSLCHIKNDKLISYKTIPLGTHDVIFFKDGIVFNDTSNDRVVYRECNSEVVESFLIKKYKKDKLLNTDLPEDHARQGFGRGLCVADDLIIGGSSPATISVYKLSHGKPLKTVNLTMDIRNAIHGLQIWPY